MILTIPDKNTLVVTVQTRKEAIDLVDGHLRIKKTDDEYVEWLTLERTTATIPLNNDASRGNGGWARVHVTSNYLAPYWKQLEERTGCAPFDIDITSAWGFLIRPTEFIEKIDFRTEDGLTHKQTVLIGYPRQGEMLPDQATSGKDNYQTRAEKSAVKYLQEDLGHLNIEREFIPANDQGSLYKPNPNYGRGLSSTEPRATNDTVWRILWETWVERFATQAQKDLLAKRPQCSKGDTYPSLRDYQGFHIDNYATRIPWEHLRTLGGIHEQA